MGYLDESGDKKSVWAEITFPVLVVRTFIIIAANEIPFLCVVALGHRVATRALPRVTFLHVTKASVFLAPFFLSPPHHFPFPAQHLRVATGLLMSKQKRSDPTAAPSSSIGRNEKGKSRPEQANLKRPHEVLESDVEVIEEPNTKRVSPYQRLR